MRVVVDTNVLISSFFGGNPKKVIDLWKAGDITLCLSKPIIDEYLDVLQRLKADPALISELLSLFAGGYHLLFTGTTPSLRIVPDDPGDDKFFECAVALKASVIVTGDKAMLRVANYMGIAVASPTQFLSASPVRK
jgi:putative PIN family toxin of toxin-antitoxin system